MIRASARTHEQTLAQVGSWRRTLVQLRPLALARTLAVAALLLTPSSGCAQTADPTGDPRFEQAVDLFEAWLDAKMDYEKIPGMSVGLVHDQDLVWAKGYGYAHPDEEVPATPSTMYSICSISKLFTSIGVMQQRDAGELRLDDAVSDLLPWYDVEQAYPDGPTVSVEGILTHSSGLPRESAHPYWTGPEFPFPTRDEIIEGARRSGDPLPGRPLLPVLEPGDGAGGSADRGSVRHDLRRLRARRDPRPAGHVRHLHRHPR